MVEEIDLEKCKFLELQETLDRVKVMLVRICGRGLPTYQIRSKLGKLFVDVRMDRQTDTPEFSNSISSSPGDELKMNPNLNQQLTVRTGHT